MDDDIKLLNKVFKNTTSRQNSLTKIIPKIKDENLKLLLLKHSNEYNKIYFLCKTNIYKKLESFNANSNSDKNYNDKILKTFNNPTSNIGLDISLMINNKAKNIADILIKENNSAIYDITRGIVEYQGATNETRNIANTLLNNERNNIEDLKKFI